MRRRGNPWAPPDPDIPEHPYRDTLLFHAVLALLLVAVAYLTGGGIGRAVGFAALFFVLATGWSWSRWRRRIARERRGEQSG